MRENIPTLSVVALALFPVAHASQVPANRDNMNHITSPSPHDSVGKGISTTVNKG